MYYAAITRRVSLPKICLLSYGIGRIFSGRSRDAAAVMWHGVVKQRLLSFRVPALLDSVSTLVRFLLLLLCRISSA
jgi:hypothetical protein